VNLFARTADFPATTLEIAVAPIADIAEAFSISVRPSATTYLATNTDGREGRLTVRKD